MQKKSDKKMLIILLVVLALALIGGGIWTYNSMKPLPGADNGFSIQIDEVFKIKDEAIKNVEDFLDVDFSPGTIWDDFYNDPQFRSLEDMDIEININENVGNPSPFVTPTSTDSGENTRS